MTCTAISPGLAALGPNWKPCLASSRHAPSASLLPVSRPVYSPPSTRPYRHVRVAAANGPSAGSSNAAHEPHPAHLPSAGSGIRHRNNGHEYESHAASSYAEGPLELNKEGEFDPLEASDADAVAKEEPSIWHWNDYWRPRLFWLFKALGTVID